MPIPNELGVAELAFECPKCFHPIVRLGSWFKVISTFRCETCGARIRLGYPDKLALFERHRHLMKIPPAEASAR
jgi:hypothetical protein